MTATPAPKPRHLPWLRILTGLALVVVFGCVAAALVVRQMIVQAVPPANVTSVVAPVERGDLVEAVQVNGALEPRDRARVSFPERARVAEVLVARGDEVAQGAVLARLETRDLELKVASAAAELDEALQALERLQAGPTEADLATAAAGVARARANLTSSAQEVRRIDVEVAKANLDTARQRLAGLQGGVATDDLTAAQTGVTSAEEAVVTAQQTLEQTRDSVSLAKTAAQQAMERGVQDLTTAQLAFSDATWDWDYVERTGNHPREKVVVDEGGSLANRDLESHEVEAFRRALADAEVALRNAELNVKNLTEAFDLAREEEVRQIQAAERGIVSAERALADAQRSYETASTRGVQAAILEARSEVADAEKTYNQLVNNPDRPATRAEQEAALLEAIADEQRLREGPDVAELAKARTAIEQARADLAEAEANLEAATLKAPIAGTVVDITLKPGTATTTNDAVSIADLNGFLIRSQVTEANVARLQAGQGVQVSIDSVPDETFPGELLRVSELPAESEQSGQGDALGGLYPVEIAVQVEDERLRVGMAITASIEILAIKDVLTIPLQAVAYDSEGNPTVRRVAGAPTPEGQLVEEPAPVELGATSGDLVEVVSGLAEGDEVIVPTVPPMEDILGVSTP